LSIDRPNRWAPRTMWNTPSTPGNIKQYRTCADWFPLNKTE
jgi:hypothetical protein